MKAALISPSVARPLAVILVITLIIVAALLVVALREDKGKNGPLFTGNKIEINENQRVYDGAGLLHYTKENVEESLRYFRKNYGVDFFIVTVAGLNGKSISLEAADLFSRWNIGRNNNAKGILVLLSQAEKEIKVEVGTGVEGVYTDLFCGYIERKQLKPYFQNNQVDEGLSAMMEEFIGRAEGKLSDDEIQKRIEGHLSAGGGIKKDFEIGGKEANPGEIQTGPGASSPEKLLQAWLTELKECKPNRSIYTEESQIIFDYSPNMPREMCASMYSEYSTPHRIAANGPYAVAFFPSNPRSGPKFMVQGPNGWLLDLKSTRKWIRFDYANKWWIGGREHPYAQFFNSSDVQEQVKDYDFYDDFGRFTPVRSHFREAIALFEKQYSANPKDVNAILNLADLFFDLNIEQKAAPLYQQALQMDPSQARAYRGLGLINRDAFASPDTALGYLRKYAELAPADAQAHHYIAVALWRKFGSGKDKNALYDAVKEMEKYGELSGDQAYALKRAGYYCYLLQDKERAAEKFSQLLKLDPMNDYALEMLRKVKPEAVAAALKGTEKAPWLGIRPVMAGEDVMIVFTMAESPAQRDGLLPGDIVLTFAGEKVTAEDQFLALIKKKKPNEQVDIRVLRTTIPSEIIETSDGSKSFHPADSKRKAEPPWELTLKVRLGSMADYHRRNR